MKCFIKPLTTCYRCDQNSFLLPAFLACLSAGPVCDHPFASAWQKSSSSASSEASETCQSISECSSPTSVSALGPSPVAITSCPSHVFLTQGIATAGQPDSARAFFVKQTLGRLLWP